MPRWSREAGFTLIELMIVIVIVAILASMALPAYQNSVQKGRRSDAMSAIMDVANRQEQFMLDRSTYTADMTDLGFAADPMVSEEGHYTVDTAAGACGDIAQCYLITATPAAGSPQQQDTRCATFSMDSQGARTATGTTADDCW
jgi:type IV pilus assembly protein PilE